jgi:hypothetical protein
MDKRSVRWPFYKYDVLMPEHIPTDVFVWLYLSLFVHINQQTGKSKDSYAVEEKNQVKRLIKEEFSGVIDEITLDKIIIYAERDYVLRDETVRQPEMRKILDEKAFQLLESFDDLFSSNLQIKHIYQDAITGEIVPVFEDMPYLQDCREDEYKRLNLLVSKKPSPGRIKTAYRNYLRLFKNTIDESDVADVSLFEDPDAEVDFNPFAEDTDLIDPAENNSLKDPENFNILFLERTLLNFKVDVIIENGEFHITMPFDNEKTLKWMNKCFQKARNICPELIEIVKDMQPQVNSIQGSNSVKSDIIYQKDFADQLDVCGKIYRLVESVNTPNPDNKNILQTAGYLKEYLIKIDRYFTGKSEACFVQIGKYLECLIEPLADHTDKAKRQNTDEYIFKSEIKTVCLKMHIKWNLLMRGFRDIYKNWLEAWPHYKADVADIIVSNTRFLKCGSVYPEFIENAFGLYNLRNQYGGHHKAGNQGIDNNYKPEYIESLYKVTKVFLDLY